jgi:cytochrome c biogenesis protein CcmG/thiol:disulfide interchange protein DsbE
MTTTSIPASSERQRPVWTIPAIVVVVLVLGLLAYGLRLRGLGQVNQAPAPDFTLQTFDGQMITLAALKGKPVVLNFWASWCKPCEDEAPMLEAASQKYPGVVFLGAAYVDTEGASRAYLERFKITYPNGPDLGSRMADAYRVRGVPETFFIGADGVVQAVKVGPLLSSNELDDLLSKIIE